jgi:hypothetical protein
MMSVSFVIGVSFLLEVLAGLITRHDTPPSQTPSPISRHSSLTSMDYFVRKMGTWWKWLQRWTYAAAVLTLVHWAALHDWNGTAPALVHFGPLIALEAYRVWYWYLRPRPVAA